MGTKVLVGVTQRVDSITSHNERRDALDQRLIDWLIEVGCIPVPIPNTLVDVNLSAGIDFQPIFNGWLQALNIQALILSGGNNVGESSQRDLTENLLLSWAEEQRVPVLGICRGMQVMGVWGGSRLVQVPNHVRTRHKLQVIPESGEWPDSVNSFHNQVLEECPDQFRVLALSEEGCLEAMEHSTLPWEAWMWHPERETGFSLNDQLRFRRLLNNGR